MLVWRKKTAILQAVRKKEDNGNKPLRSIIPIRKEEFATIYPAIFYLKEEKSGAPMDDNVKRTAKTPGLLILASFVIVWRG